MKATCLDCEHFDVTNEEREKIVHEYCKCRKKFVDSDSICPKFKSIGTVPQKLNEARELLHQTYEFTDSVTASCNIGRAIALLGEIEEELGL